MSIALSRLRAILALAVLAVLMIPGISAGQTMSFSVYTDSAVTGDGLTMYMYATTVDNSSGCSHINYASTATIYSPSGRSASSTYSGLYTTTQMATDFEIGEWGLVTTGTYNCSCIGYGQASYGHNEPVQSVTYRHHYNLKEVRSGKDLWVLDSDSRERKCAHSEMEYEPPSTAFDMTDSGLYFYFVRIGKDVACIAYCSPGWTGSVSGPGGSIRGPGQC